MKDLGAAKKIVGMEITRDRKTGLALEVFCFFVMCSG
jgi:hypothetical protein